MSIYRVGEIGGGVIATYRNLIIVFLICGLWHGAAWTFIIWGLYHGLILLAERILEEKKSFSLKSWTGNIITLAIVLIGWVIFRSESISQCLAFFKPMIGVGRRDTFLYYGYAYFVTPQTVFAAVIGAILAVAPIEKNNFSKNIIAKNCVLILLLMLSMIYI